MDGKQTIKCVVVGDAAVGKTSLIVSYTTGSFPNCYAPTIWDSYDSEAVAGASVKLSIFDTAGEEEYDRIRPRSYPNTHVFILCYAINNPSSYLNVLQKWLPEVQHHCPTANIMVVGTKNDLRENGDDNITKTTTLKEQNNDGCLSLECSALTSQGLNELFEKVIELAAQVKLQ